MSGDNDELNLQRLQTDLNLAVIDASGWKKVCDTLAEMTGSVGTVLLPFTTEKRGAWLVNSDSAGELVEHYVRDGWYRHDYREGTLQVMRQRGYATDFDCADEGIFRSHAYYQEFLRAYGFGLFIGIHIPSQSGDWCAAIQRSVNSEAPGARQLELLPRIRAMLTDAVRTSTAISALGVENWRAHFETADRGFALLDRAGHVSQLNETAAALLAPFLRAQGVLVFDDPGIGARVTELILRACAKEPGMPLPAPVQLQLEPGVSLAIDVSPLPPPLRQFHVEAAAILTVRLTQMPLVDHSSRLAARFGFTASELRLALRIGAGESLRDAGDAEGISYETARTRLKGIFVKTNVSRQAELALLISRVVAG